jgi:hypothetical protein
VSKKVTILIYLAEMVWCIWLINTTWEQMQDKPTWWAISSFWISIGLLCFWAVYVYRAAFPKLKKLDFMVEKDVLDNWWVTRDGLIKSGPYPYRHEAFEWIIQQTTKEMRR